MFQRNWTYCIIGDISKTFVDDALGHFLPDCMVFFDNSNDNPWFVQENSVYGKYPLPSDNNAIAIFRRDDPRFPMKNAVGLAYTGKASISWLPTESEELLGLRIWHEVLHASGADSDQMVKNDRVAFGNWLKEYYPQIADEFIQNYAAHEHDQLYQKYYYRYLTILLNPLCGKSPVFDFEATPRDGTAPFTATYSMIGEPRTWMWKFPGGEVIGTPLNKVMNPIVTYNTPGVYDAELTASDLFDTAVIHKSSYITVRERPPSPLQRIIDFFHRLFGG